VWQIQNQYNRLEIQLRYCVTALSLESEEQASSWEAEAVILFAILSQNPFFLQYFSLCSSRLQLTNTFIAASTLVFDHRTGP
jgi:hypothetical protein